jgi:nucleotide-binding universal stress UspA family protein
MSPGLGFRAPIVVGVERSDRSRDALALARVLGRAVGTRLILVAVYPVGARSATLDQGAYAQALAEEAESALDWVTASLTGPRPESRAVAATSIPRGLQQVADTEGALAIVVGPSHRGPLGRIVPGSVGEQLLRGSRCPVAVAPRGYRRVVPAVIERLGVGYLAVPEAEQALRSAVGLATRSGAAVRVLSVVEPPTSGASPRAGWNVDGLETTAREHLAARITSAIDEVATPVAISGEVVDGYADDELARLSLEVDLLICGASGDRPVGSVMLGDVSAGILRKARCPVLMVPRGARAGFAALRAPAAWRSSTHTLRVSRTGSSGLSG